MQKAKFGRTGACGQPNRSLFMAGSRFPGIQKKSRRIKLFSRACIILTDENKRHMSSVKSLKFGLLQLWRLRASPPNCFQHGKHAV